MSAHRWIPDLAPRGREGPPLTQSRRTAYLLFRRKIPFSASRRWSRCLPSALAAGTLKAGNSAFRCSSRPGEIGCLPSFPGGARRRCSSQDRSRVPDNRDKLCGKTGCSRPNHVRRRSRALSTSINGRSRRKKVGATRGSRCSLKKPEKGAYSPSAFLARLISSVRRRDRGCHQGHHYHRCRP